MNDSSCTRLRPEYPGHVWAYDFVEARTHDGRKLRILTIGATPEGGKELVGFQVGVRESAQTWRELLVEVKRRGLTMVPEIAVGDGALDFWKAIEEVWPATRHQRCWVHKVANVLNKMSKSVQPSMKTDLRERYSAPECAAAEKAVAVFVEKYGRNEVEYTSIHSNPPRQSQLP